jgi:hypothetical protein
MKRKLFMLSLALLGAITANARVKMVALPERARAVVSLSNPSAALLEEERLITLQKGPNKIDFSWRGVNIDPTSIQVRILEHPDNVTVVNTSFPPNENALIWEMHSAAAREERVRISYLLHGLTREIAYKAVAEPNETALTLRSYLRLRNNSGEDLSNAEIYLGQGDDFKKTLAHEEVLEILSERNEAVPIRKLLRWDSKTLPWDPEYQQQTVGIPLSYVLTNSAAAKLGQHTLAHGKARIFLKSKGSTNGVEAVTFTGEDWAALTPVDRELSLYIGQSRDVKVTQRQVKNDRVNIRRNNHNQDVMWDTEEEIKIEIENFKKTPIDLVLVQHIAGYWKMVEASHQYEKKDAFTLEFPLTLRANSTGAAKTIVTFQFNRLNVQGQEIASY